MSKSLLSQLTEATTGLTDPTAHLTTEVVKENTEQMKVGDGFESLLAAFNASGPTGKKVFLNLLQDNGYVTIVDPRFIYQD